jgi:Glycosyltransferase sugar-binding region containing DXD motif
MRNPGQTMRIDRRLLATGDGTLVRLHKRELPVREWRKMCLGRRNSRPSAAVVAADPRARNAVMRWLIQSPEPAYPRTPRASVPRVLVQFWDEHAVPPDVLHCMDSWRSLERRGFERLVFDDLRARDYIGTHLGPNHLRAYERCLHPAMKSDYFRLCFIARHGGFYVDADEVFQGVDCESLFADPRLKLQPLCYDAASDEMVAAEVFTRPGSDPGTWTLYVANDPLIAPPDHPVVRSALVQATARLLDSTHREMEIQAIAGPGNLTTCVVMHALATRQARMARDFQILHRWRSISVTEWALDYRSDGRNWRNWTVPTDSAVTDSSRS